MAGTYRSAAMLTVAELKSNIKWWQTQYAKQLPFTDDDHARYSELCAELERREPKEFMAWALTFPVGTRFQCIDPCAYNDSVYELRAGGVLYNCTKLWRVSPNSAVARWQSAKYQVTYQPGQEANMNEEPCCTPSRTALLDTMKIGDEVTITTTTIKTGTVVGKSELYNSVQVKGPGDTTGAWILITDVVNYRGKTVHAAEVKKRTGLDAFNELPIGAKFRLEGDGYDRIKLSDTTYYKVGSIRRASGAGFEYGPYESIKVLATW